MGRKQKGPGTTFPDNWKEIMIEAGKQGLHNQELFSKLKLGHSTHSVLLRRNEEYKTVYEEYLIHHENYWVNRVQEELIENGAMKFNAKLFVLLMGNKQRTRWKSKKK